VKSLSTDDPFRLYNGVSDYSQWLFTYIDLEPGFGMAGAGRGRGLTPGGTAGTGGLPGSPGGAGGTGGFPGSSGSSPGSSSGFPD
jgi:hypothetical protein